jgi:branched-chain amino acid aminotransferase
VFRRLQLHRLNLFGGRDSLIWFDGDMVAWRDAKLHVLTHGLHYGSAVFEG